MGKHVVVLQRKLTQQSSERMIRKQMDHLIGRALGGNRGKTWETQIAGHSSPKMEGDYWLFERKIIFTKTSGHKDGLAEQKQWGEIVQILQKTGNGSKYKKYPWVIVKGAEILANHEGKGGNEKPKVISDVKNFADINVDVADHFDHVYGRQPQINIVISSIQAAIDSEFQNRFHCVLHGDPGCGKTEILQSVGRMLGKENDAYMVFDATSSTEAGVSKILLEAEHIPPVLIIEEIEKAEEKSLRWLLGVLDQRAEIRRTNFRIGHRARNVKLLCLATVNDIRLFRSAMSGALASRFSNQVFCPRPDRFVLEMILKREVAKVKMAKQEWIELALDFCDEMGWDDPRKVVPVCLCGGDRLLDGSYQNDLKKTQPPKG